jgi:hypothetical protein
VTCFGELHNGTRTVIAIREFEEGDEMDQSPTDPPADDQPPADPPYEVRRSRPQNNDSFVGGLDILTVHRMIEDIDQENTDKEKRSPSGDTPESR